MFSHRHVNKYFPGRKKLEKNPTILLVVAAALINDTGKVLLQKRPENKSMGGLWEFPGGKVEPGERPVAALARELNEELGITASPANFTPITFAAEPLDGRELLLLLYACSAWQGEPCALESPEIAWLSVGDMLALPMPPADAPFIPILRDYVLRGVTPVAD